MRRLASGLAAGVLAAGLGPVVFAQQPKGDLPKVAPAKGANTRAPGLAKADEVLATVNGEKITRGDVVRFLSNYSYTPGDEQTYYEIAVNQIVNGKLITQFAKQQKVTVSREEIDQDISLKEEQLRKNNTSLASALADSNTSMEELRQGIGESLLWRNFLKTRASDPELKKYADRNRDVFNGTLVRASHIQINLPENAPEAEVEKAKQKLIGIKKEIESGKIGFADAANKYSEAEDNVAQPSGGDVDWFPRRRLTESFAATAFALKPGQVSEPVRTEYGLHLIQVTDRKDGGDFQFERYKDRVRELFGEDLQKDIVQKMRSDPKTKIEIKPMPADMFPKVPVEAPAPKEEAKVKS